MSMVPDIASGAAAGSTFGPWGAAIGAGVGLLGDVMGFMGGQSTNAAQMALAQQQMAFQKDMATHAMQYRVADLKAAGLNPMLATGIGGAQAMPGAMAQLQNPGQSFQNAGQQATNALQLYSQGAQIDQMKAQTDLMKAQAVKTAGADTQLGVAQAQLADSTRVLLQPAQAKSAVAAAQLDDSNRARVDQQINSGDIAASINLMRQQAGAARAQQYMDIAIGKFNNMNAIEQQYALPLMIQKLGLTIQQMDLSLPEMRAIGAYYETKMGQLSFAQRQVQSGISTATDVFKAFKPGLGGSSGSDAFMRGVGPGGMGAGAPQWPVNP